jgi:3-hydroxy-9,10-secoandrosta-1,3,5(10)-triene-9,17-dione monooxygenase reductase component
MTEMTFEAHGDGGAGFSPDAFRRVLGQFATGVTVVTACDGEEVHGITANSFTSVSLTPPLVLVCIDKGGRFDRILRTSGRYCVNILGEEHQAISNRFARRRAGGPSEFADCSEATTRCGAPILKDSLAHMDCRVVDVHDAGDHHIFIGLVESCGSAADGEALVFFRGRYRSLSTWTRSPLVPAGAGEIEIDFGLSSL